MRTADLWLLTVLLWRGLSWLSAYLASGLTSVSRLASLRPRSSKPLTPRSEDDCPTAERPPSDPPDCAWPILHRRLGTKSKTSAAGGSSSAPKATRASIPTVSIA